MPDFDATARDALKAQAGEEIAFVPLAERPDRWGRIPSFVFFDPPAPGAAAVEPDGSCLQAALPASCRRRRRALAEPLSSPRRPRHARPSLAFGPIPSYAVIAATDRDAFAERAATNVIVEGRLVGVEKGSMRTNLQFAPRSEHSFSVTVLQRNVKIFEQVGLDFHALIGRTLRVRGLLDLRFGPQIEISSADEIELIPEAGDDRALGPEGSSKPQ
jgi:hypothetical protein